MILQGMVLLLVLMHPLVSQTGDLVCIRAFFRVVGKAASGADRQKTACTATVLQINSTLRRASSGDIAPIGPSMVYTSSSAL